MGHGDVSETVEAEVVADAVEEDASLQERLVGILVYGRLDVDV